MKFLKLLIIGLLAFATFSCGGDAPKKETEKPEVKKEVKETPKAEVKETPKEEASMGDIGVGPIKEAMTLGELDKDLAAKGADVYKAKCTACHKPEEKFIGPAPKGIIQRRSPAWIMNMILAPEQMVKEDPTAMALLKEFNGVPMTNQKLTNDEARSILEYFRTL